MFIKPLSRTMLCILVILVVSSGILTGCNKNSATLPIFSDTDSQILVSAYTDYYILRQNSSPDVARQELVNKLNAEEGVEEAYLGADGTSIFFTYDDGFLGIIDTFDPDEKPQEKTSYLPNDGSSGVPDFKATNLSLSLTNTGVINKVTYVKNSDTVEYQPQVSPLDAQPNQMTPKSNKVLILQPICPGEDAYTTTASELPALFAAKGWDYSDVDLKMNTGEIDDDPTPRTYKGDGSGLLDVKPEDYYDLGRYGVILFFGHGATGDALYNAGYFEYSGDNFYLEFANITSQTLNENTQLRTWGLNKQIAFTLLAVATNAKPNDLSTRIYRMYIRSDLLQEKMGQLPRSYVQLASCFGYGFSTVFMNNGAGMFMSWDNKVTPVIADDNEKNMIKLMLGGMSASDAYKDSSVTKSDNYGDDGWHWGADFLKSMDLVSNYYLPAWIKLKVIVSSQFSNLKSGTSNIHVYLLDDNSQSVAGAQLNLASGQNEAEFTLEKHYLTGNYLLPGHYRISVDGWNTDYNGGPLSAGDIDVDVHCGANNVEIQLADLKWTDDTYEGPPGWSGVDPTTLIITPTTTPTTIPTNKPTTAPTTTTTTIPSTTPTTKPPQTKLQELTNDDGSEEGWVSLGGKSNWGFMVRFTASPSFAVTKIRIYNKIKGTPVENAQFTLRITDKDLNPKWETSLPMTLFTTEPTWLEVQLPNNLTVGNTFCILLNAPSLGQGLGPYIGIDETGPNLGSETISGWQLVPWVAQPQKDTANWMIRAVGYAMIP